MSLRYALLGLIAEQPASGYDLLKVFDQSLAFVWPATQSQLYGELNRLAADGLIEVTRQGARGRKDYAITADGRAEFVRWLSDEEPDRVRRNEPMLRVFFLGALGPDRARAYLEHEAEVYESLVAQLESVERNTSWDEDDFDRYGHLVMESGLRYARSQAEWARWAATQVPK
jgi:DNA-binding PadR family transcriptional regulator